MARTPSFLVDKPQPPADPLIVACSKKCLTRYGFSHLTYAAGETSDLKTLQALVGHSTIQMTMDHYVHVQPEKLKELGNKMHNLFVQ